MHFKLRPTLWQALLTMMLPASVAPLATSCKDDYIYDDKAPDNLGESIYAELNRRGNFKTMLRLIDDLGYAETLSRTGSKTLFAADDQAFETFFTSNSFGAHSYDDLTPAQKRLIMNNSMINMSYLAEMLSNVAGTDGATPGMALRRYTSATAVDSLQYLNNAKLFENPFWERFANKGIYLSVEAPMIVHFTSSQMATQGMTKSDFSIIYTGQEFEGDDIYVNGIKIAQRDITCKNGYIHIMEKVMIPAGTMADAIGRADDATIFSSLLEKFSAPYFNESTDKALHDYYNGSSDLRPSLAQGDSIFTKRYFNERNCNYGPNRESLSSYGMLYYDPSETNYSSSSPEQDMGTMFVPTDKAMKEYINGGKGSYLRDAYGSWENIPTDILAMFIKNHQKRSFNASLPHSWDVITDESSYPMSISTSDIERVEVTNNGVVYFVNTVLPPIDYQGVYASVLTDDNMQVMKWAITDNWNDLSDIEAMRFYMYLRSMENMYNVLLPTDEALRYYREPISWARGGTNREIWSFVYDKPTNSVNAEVYYANEDGSKGELKRTYNGNTNSGRRIIRNRLSDIINLHIVIGNNEDGNLSGFIDESDAKYVLTKGGGTIKISGREGNLKVNGAGDIEFGSDEASIVTSPTTGTLCRYSSDNGRTFFIDHILHDATTNVYSQLEAHPEFKAFFDLCRGNSLVFNIFLNDEDVQEIFSQKQTTTSSAIGYVVNSFNNYRYTIFVPTEDALNEAFRTDPKLYTWDEIAADSNETTKKQKTLYLLKFILFHFVDNSAFITGTGYGPAEYETGARNDYDKFHKVRITSDGNSLTVTSVDNPSSTAKVITSGGLYNIMARDIIVNTADVSEANQITASSRAVIHLVDHALLFQ
ncbi:MAG: adenylate cyclase [Bacteroides sp.]|nr:adenylate cyclase [Bacteroides sp.]